MKPEKIYLKASVKARTTPFNTEVISLGVRASDIIEFCEKHANERGFVNFVISPRKEVGQYGDTHSVFLDTFKPKRRDEDEAF